MPGEMQITRSTGRRLLRSTFQGLFAQPCFFQLGTCHTSRLPLAQTNGVLFFPEKRATPKFFLVWQPLRGSDAGGCPLEQLFWGLKSALYTLDFVFDSVRLVW